MPTSQQKLVRFQHLRAIAALIVTASHSVADVNRLYGFEAVNFYIPGQFGVEIFFVISGFIIFLISAQEGQSRVSIWQFLANRVWRIVPLYWIFTAVFITLALAMPNSVNRSELDLSHVIASLVFLPLEGPSGSMSPVYSLGWSLNYEAFFYLLFAVLLSFGRLTAICGTSLLMAALVMLNSIAPEGTAAAVWTMPYLLEFGAGMWIAAGVRTVSFRIPAWTFWPGMCATLAISAIYFSYQEVHYTVSPVTILLAILFVMVGAFSAEPKRRGCLNALMEAVGDSSYSLYLTHMFTIRAIVLAFAYLSLGRLIPAPVIWLLTVGICALAAYGNFLLLERRAIPALRLRLRHAARGWIARRLPQETRRARLAPP
jgi:exopolysaccharide production protein ExoZ